MRAWSTSLLLAALAGCAQPAVEQPSACEESLFNATAMRIHPVFTQIKDWTGDGKPDGIEVLLEFQDQFGDPTKAAGTVMFELFSYRQANSDPRGQRVVNPWIGSIATRRDQLARWNRTSRTYTFQLSCPGIDPARPYVLDAAFRPTSGPRIFDRVVLAAQEEPVGPEPAPSTKPAATRAAMHQTSEP